MSDYIALSPKEIASKAALSAETLARMSEGYCPDCGHRGFVLGPRGANGRDSDVREMF